MRTAFINTLLNLAEDDHSIFMLTADLGYGLFDRFRDAYPTRFVDIGVAEANTIGIAAGLSLSGKNVYCYSIATFLMMRCFEQIRIDLCYQNLNVKLIGVGAGWSYGLEGMTHHAIEDVAIMRALPNMTVVAPGDPLEAMAAIKESAFYSSPMYIRFGKNNDPQVHNDISDFKIGKGIVMREGDDLTIIASGTMLHTAKQITDMLIKEGISTRLISMHTIKPLDEDIIMKCAKDSAAIFTIEEHSVIGGLGSAVVEVLLELKYSGLFSKIGLPDTYTPGYGSRDYLHQIHNLDAHSLADRIVKEYRQLT